MIVANLGYMTGKGVSRNKSNTEILNFIGTGDGISKKLGGKFLHKGLPGLSIANAGEFCFPWIKFQSDTIHPFLNASKTDLSILRHCQFIYKHKPVQFPVPAVNTS